MDPHQANSQQPFLRYPVTGWSQLYSFINNKKSEIDMVLKLIEMYYKDHSIVFISLNLDPSLHLYDQEREI